ncbi:hypothetical protein JX266_009579 [Neoarthrinium moseri]|nr:hypothetical protein JX266_009579 [Neoarthrinium moseri]
MRLRASNKGKRFHPHNYFPELDSSDEDQQVPADKHDDSDDGFVGDDHAEDDFDKDDEVELEASSAEEDEVASEPASELEPTSHFPVSRRKQIVDAEALDEDGIKIACGQVQPYPTDSSAKWTRSYAGPVTRYARLPDLCKYWYGDRVGYAKIINGLVKLWARYEIYPPKLLLSKDQNLAKSPWVSSNFWEAQQQKFLDWYVNYLSARQKPSVYAPLSEATASRWYLPQAETGLTALLGPHDDQKEHVLKQGDAIALLPDGGPAEEATEDDKVGGWMFDVGGIVLSMDWAPRIGEVDQLLAMTVIPYADQAFYQNPEETPHEATLKQGSVQIWSVPLKRSSKGLMAFSSSRPRLASALCTESGRVLRMQWCPVALTVGGVIGLLAVLMADGKVRVLEVRQSPSKNMRGTFEEIQEPLATIELKSEYNVKITSFAWLNVNRVAVGHSDGSVAVWSLYPCMMLQRHPIHSSPVMDIKSGYPSHPFIVATVPTGGVVTVTDLNRPNAELVYCANLNISLQPNLLAWCEHMRGFVSLWPSSSPANNSVSFMAIRTWPQTRFAAAANGQVTCLDVGTHHPYLLVGSTEGTLWLSNPFRRIFFFKNKHKKLRIFQHDYQALNVQDKDDQDTDQEVPRGVCRILHGFQPEHNAHPKHEKSNAMAKRHGGQKKAKKGKSKKKAPVIEAEEADEDLEDEGDGSAMPAGDITIHDPLTRISAVTWNPNIQFSWWAAAATASGLVRIMDLGTEQLGEGSSEDEEDFVDEDSDIVMGG